MRLTDDGINVVKGSAAPAGQRPPFAPEPTPQTLDEQVAAMTVDDVADAIEAGEIDRAEAVAAERRGRARAGILAFGDEAEG